MYWQWANAYITQTTNFAVTMAELQPCNYLGYYEMSYWHTAYFNTIANGDNQGAFATVNLFVDDTIQGVNFEHLFLTYDIYSNNPTSAPPSNSLFDLNNFKTLLSLG